MKNLIDAGTNTAATVNVNGIIPITTIVRRFNRVNAPSEVDAVGDAITIESKTCKRPRSCS